MAVSVADPKKAAALQQTIGGGVQVYSGNEGLIKLATMPEADIVLIAIVGTAGFATRVGRDSRWQRRLQPIPRGMRWIAVQRGPIRLLEGDNAARPCEADSFLEQPLRMPGRACDEAHMHVAEAGREASFVGIANPELDIG